MTTPDEVLALASWLGERGRRGAQLGIEVEQSGENEYSVGLSDGSSWQGAHQITPDDAVAQVLRLNLTPNNGLTFVAPSIPTATEKLAILSGLDREELAKRFVGDLESVQYATGVEYPQQPNVLAAATTSLLLWQSTLTQRPPTYLQKIGVPWQRLRCETQKPKGAPWSAHYPELLSRVIAHYSNETLLVREAQTDNILGLLEERLAEVEALAKFVNHDFAYTCLLYAATGYDRDFFEKRLGDVPVPRNEVLDRIIPTVRSMAMEEYGNAMSSGAAHTLYGRRIPVQRGNNMGEVLWFILGGTVQDIMAIATITFRNIGAYVQPTIFASECERIALQGTIPQKDERQFAEDAAKVAALGSPLTPIPTSVTLVFK